MLYFGYVFVDVENVCDRHHALMARRNYEYLRKEIKAHQNRPFKIGHGVIEPWS